jgi:glutathione synthase/RimK-type ligase-like ATP-grasp enzyme
VFSFPLILKAIDGSKGDDNYLVKNHDELVAILNDSDKTFMVQNFVPNDGDLRILFIGLDREPLVFRRKGAGTSHLNNTSKGGEGSFLSIKELDAQVRVDAYRAAEVLRREIGGVDIIIDKETGRHYVLEVNATPAIATGYGGSRKLNEFVSFLEETLFDDTEEE